MKLFLCFISLCRDCTLRGYDPLLFMVVEMRTVVAICPYVWHKVMDNISRDKISDYVAS